MGFDKSSCRSSLDETAAARLPKLKGIFTTLKRCHPNNSGGKKLTVQIHEESFHRPWTIDQSSAAGHDLVRQRRLNGKI